MGTLSEMLLLIATKLQAERPVWDHRRLREQEEVQTQQCNITTSVTVPVKVKVQQYFQLCGVKVQVVQ